MDLFSRGHIFADTPFDLISRGLIFADGLKMGYLAWIYFRGRRNFDFINFRIFKIRKGAQENYAVMTLDSSQKLQKKFKNKRLYVIKL